jgi:hypothetical protein
MDVRWALARGLGEYCWSLVSVSWLFDLVADREASLIHLIDGIARGEVQSLRDR